MVSTILFGDKLHTFRQTTETARKAGKKGRAKSPWGKGMFSSSKALKRAIESGYKERPR